MSEVQVEIPTAEVEVPTEVRNIIEALIFACDEPMSVRFIRSVMEEANKDLPPDEQITVNAEVVRKAVAELNRGYGSVGSAFRIIEIAGGFIHATQEQFSTWVGKLAKERARRRLSPTAVETLAIIAYKQPITKAEVEFIRGVNADYIITALLEKDLIHITGRQNTPGRPLLYGTTQKFLEHFGLNELSDLPKPREIAELINETEMEVDRRLLAEQQELEFRDTLENKLEGHEGAAKMAQKENADKATKGRRKKTEAVPMVERSMEEGVGSKETEVREQKSEAAVVQENVEENPEIKSGEVSTLGTIGEHAMEEKNETPIEAEESVDVTTEASVEPVVPLQQKMDIDEGVELSAQRVNIKEEQSHPEAVGAGEEKNPATGWSKWKTKVKTFFKKLFG